VNTLDLRDHFIGILRSKYNSNGDFIKIPSLGRYHCIKNISDCIETEIRKDEI